jgi:hypothetical protein
VPQVSILGTDILGSVDKETIIRLTVEANDPEVAGLLEYLEANVKNTKRGEWIALLQRTIDWMKPVQFLYGVNQREVNQSHSSLIVLPSKTHTQSHPLSSLDQEADKLP